MHPTPHHSRPWLRGLMLLLAVTGLAGCDRQSPPSGDKGKPVHLVETAPVVSDNLSVVRTRAGTLRAQREVKVYTQEEGRIVELPLYEGDRVTEGDLLVRLDDVLIKAQLARASATRKQAAQDARRLNELRGKKLVSEDEYARARTALDVAEADEQVLKTRLGYTVISSPLGGVVSARLSEPGNIAERHQHLLTISDPSSLVTELPVSELVLPDLALGDVARVRIDALGDQVFEARITRIYPSLDPVTRRGTIEVEINPVPAGAAPGQLCRVELNTRATLRRVIPFAALRRDADSEYVYVLDGENRAQRVAVVSGLRLAERIEIREGLEDDQKVITKGFLGLTPGKQVKPVERTAL
ncbi:MAG: efflux RND transporter periplasmic adaptor subunit [Gammaproteobacteria bacterium]|nr:efflux RND transporter periplasmic adaptor subunit [Gammaproteobacteria bacterium]